MVHKHLVQRLCEILGTILVRNIPVRGVALEELCFMVESVAQAFVRVDVLLAAVNDTDESELEGVDTAGEDVQGVGACVHQVEFREDTNCSAALWVHGACKLQGLRVRQVDVGGGNGEDDAVWVDA